MVFFNILLASSIPPAGLHVLERLFRAVVVKSTKMEQLW